jgi:hypothetical protein
MSSSQNRRTVWRGLLWDIALHASLKEIHLPPDAIRLYLPIICLAATETS